MRRTIVTVGMALGALATPVAHAALPPDRTATVSASAPTFAWEGARATGYHVYWTAPVAFDPSRCSKNADTYCDITHVRLEAAPDSTATLTVTLTEFSSPAADFDVYIYTSTPDGQPIEVTPQTGCCQPAGTDENVSLANAAPGHYLVYVPYWLVNDASFKGKVTGADIVALPAPPPQAQSAPPPQEAQTSRPALPLRLPSKAKQRGRTLPIRITATQTIHSLRVQLRPTTGGGVVLGEATRERLQPGKTGLTLKLKRNVKPGRYYLRAWGLIDGYRQQTKQLVRLTRRRPAA